MLSAVDLGNPGPGDDYDLVDVAEAYELAGSMCLADFDGDYDVGSSDLAVLAVERLRTDCTGETVCQSDLDSDGEVNFRDYAEFTGQHWADHIFPLVINEFPGLQLQGRQADILLVKTN